MTKTHDLWGQADQAFGPVRADLAAVGFDADNLPADQVSVRRYVPVLVKWLPLVDSWLAKEWIVQSLTSPFADAAVDVLIQAFEEADRSADDGTMCVNGINELRWAIGSALEKIGPAVPVERMVHLLSNPDWRPSAVMVALALGKAARRKESAAAAASALPRILDDPTVGGHAVDGLASGRLALSGDAAAELRPLVARYLDDEAAWVRKSAKRALVKLDACE